jgi:dihydrofolate reductase
MLASVFIATSADGFIARPDGAIDWLPHENVEDHGFSEFFASVDALVMGRGTFETVLGFGKWPYEKKRVVVLSSRPLDLSIAGDAPVQQMSGEPARIAAQLAEQGVKHIYVDGGGTIQRFLRAGLIQRLIITQIPVLIGKGIPLFGELAEDVRLRHVATRTFPSGLVQTEYAVEAVSPL